MNATIKLYAGLAVVTLAALWYGQRQAAAAVKATANAVNPLNPENVFSSAANAVVSATTGRDETLGGWLYDLTHADPMATANPVTVKPKAPAELAQWNTQPGLSAYFGA